MCECKMDVKSAWVPTGQKWIMFHGHLDNLKKNHLLKVGLTQNHETMALRTLTTVDLFYLLWLTTRMNRNSF